MEFLLGRPRRVHELLSLSHDQFRGSCTEYLCNWAFELLRTSRTSVGLDFRRMIFRFDAQFRGRNGRCIKGSTDACRGGQPESCQRFTEAETAAQSVHSPPCNGRCHRILWSASSYRQCPKPAAVVADEASRTLEYSPVSSHTLAISHVWSHGQGGRPESGINTCLHQRYCRLARRFGCDTYWIDAAAIPSETSLRRQAIDNIATIFAAARVTLVIDADVQSVELSQPDATVAEIETLVSTLLVCDWSVRGWTMLEAIRGSRAIHLLCKGDRTIRLVTALATLHRHGAVDMAVLLGSAQHLIPHSDQASTKTVEEAGYILSQRHTSWPEDIIICWTLLMHEPVQKTAGKLWTNQTRVRTGYLVSSAPRVQGVPGLGWAPASPYIRPLARHVDLAEGKKQEYTVRFPPYDGDGSLYATISNQGLWGRWRVINVDRSLLDDAQDVCCDMMPPPQAYEEDIGLDRHAAADEVFAHPDDALAWQTVNRLLGRGATVRLLRALADDGVSPYTGTSQRGEDVGLAVVVCARFDRGATWQWIGVFSWQESDDFGAWEGCDMLIV